MNNSKESLKAALQFIEYIYLISAFVVLNSCSLKTIDANAESDDRKKVSLGVIYSNQIVHLDKKINSQADSAIQVKVVFPYSSAFKAGLQTNDLIIGIDNTYFKSKKDDFVAKFTAEIKSKKIGEVVTFKVLRMQIESNYQIDGKSNKLAIGEEVPINQVYSPSTEHVSVNWDKFVKELDVKLTLEGRQWNYGNTTNDISFVKSEINQGEDFRKKIEKFIPNESKEDENDLLSRFQDLGKQGDLLRLGLVTYLQQNPFQVAQVQKQILQSLKSCQSGQNIWTCLKKLIAISGFKNRYIASKSLEDLKTPQDFLKRAQEIYIKSENLLNKAFEKLSQNELAQLKEFSKKIISKIESGEYVEAEKNPGLQLVYGENLLALQKVKLNFIIESLLVYEEILNSDFLNKLKNSIPKEKELLPIVEELQTKAGLFLIGGVVKNNYSNYTSDSVKMIIDLGGDDYYPDISANIIDYSGSDAYESSTEWSLNSGFFRTRILYDMAGDDTYLSAKGGIASSFCGASLLLDHKGNDKYISQTFSEGFSLAGLSVLAELSGNDLYQSTMLSQAVGMAGGLGFLFDFSGDDYYFSKGAAASEYQDPGQFSGWSQGVGVGIRSFVSGGWGLLYDGQGKDRFEAGTFSQGGGYYFGIGSLINDSNQDDYYSGGRYCQGFSAHYAFGTFLDVGGNDTYTSNSVVGLGLAWDLSLSYFNDQAGNDFYNHPGHFIGSASHNSFSFFIDDKGEDNYSGDGLPYEVKANDYHGGKSLGFFWDRGHSNDKYKKLKNNSVQVVPGLQILVDE